MKNENEFFSREATLELMLSVHPSVRPFETLVYHQIHPSKSTIKIKHQNQVSKSSVKIKCQIQASKSSVKIKHHQES